MRIIVADDSRVMRQIVVRTLRQAGFDWEVMEAEDGAQALQLALSESPDLVLSDWNMPNMLGIAAAAGDRVKDSGRVRDFRGFPSDAGNRTTGGCEFPDSKTF